MSDFYQILFENQALLESKILAHVAKDTCIKHHREEFTQLFCAYMEPRMEEWINYMKFPLEADDKFDPIAWFMGFFCNTMYPRARSKIFAMLERREKVLFTRSMTKMNGESIEIEDTENNVEDKVINDNLKVTLEKAILDFCLRQTSVDRDLFYHIRKESSARVVAECVFKVPCPNKSDIDKATCAIANLKFRFACYLSTLDFQTPEFCLKGLNKSKKLVKRFFGTEYLSELPSKQRLLDVAFSMSPKGEFTEGFAMKHHGWKPWSKTSFKGKVYDHFVVYESPTGVLYDYTCNVMGIIGENGKAKFQY